jgi:hypothetical protein
VSVKDSKVRLNRFTAKAFGVGMHLHRVLQLFTANDLVFARVELTFFCNMRTKNMRLKHVNVFNRAVACKTLGVAMNTRHMGFTRGRSQSNAHVAYRT